MLEARKRILGLEHPDTLDSMFRLAFTLKEDGRVAEVISLMKECARLRKSALGVDHPQTLHSVTALFSWYEETWSPPPRDSNI